MINTLNAKDVVVQKVRKFVKREKSGGFNQILGVAVLVAIVLLVEWPTVKTVISTTWTTLTTWFSTNIGKVFTNLP